MQTLYQLIRETEGGSFRFARAAVIFVAAGSCGDTGRKRESELTGKVEFAEKSGEPPTLKKDARRMQVGLCRFPPGDWDTRFGSS
jgi:hypothetical protein